MLGVRWSPPLLALLFISNLILLAHTIHMGYLNFHFLQIIWNFSILIHSYASNIHDTMTTSNLIF